jgi:hypothetical protein
MQKQHRLQFCCQVGVDAKTFVGEALEEENERSVNDMGRVYKYHLKVIRMARRQSLGSVGTESVLVEELPCFLSSLVERRVAISALSFLIAAS